MTSDRSLDFKLVDNGLRGPMDSIIQDKWTQVNPDFEAFVLHSQIGQVL